MAILDALNRAKQEGLSNIWVKSDVLETIIWLN